MSTGYEIPLNPTVLITDEGLGGDHTITVNSVGMAQVYAAPMASDYLGIGLSTRRHADFEQLVSAIARATNRDFSKVRNDLLFRATVEDAAEAEREQQEQEPVRRSVWDRLFHRT